VPAEGWATRPNDAKASQCESASGSDGDPDASRTGASADRASEHSPRGDEPFAGVIGFVERDEPLLDTATGDRFAPAGPTSAHQNIVGHRTVRYVRT